MATTKIDTRQLLSFGVRMRMFVRFLGLTAVLAAGAGAIYLSSVLPDWKSDTLQRASKNDLGGTAFYGCLMLFGGALIALLAGVVEILASFRGGSSGHGSAGINSAVQVVLAAGLVIAINVYAFIHPSSFDTTSNSQFTLPKDIVADLQKLKSETTIVVLQQHKTYGQLAAKPDRYDYAAERKVVEKVLDTVELFRKFGPQFKVVVLDVEDENFHNKFDKVTKDRPVLRDAINAAPENSIFFWSEGKVQRMSFNEFYQLDKAESKKGAGNLVLQPQGIDSLVKKITVVEEKRPKIGVAVCHEWLTTQVTEGQEQYTLAGLRKALTDYGFDVVDIVLKRRGQPVAFTYEETKLTRLEEELTIAKRKLSREKRFTDLLAKHRKRIDEVQSKDLLERIGTYEAALLEVIDPDEDPLTPEQRKNRALVERVERFVLANMEALEERQPKDEAKAEKEKEQAEKEIAEIQQQERALEDSYLTDVKPKLTRMLDECDLLILPRMTIINPTLPDWIPPQLHQLNDIQANVIRDFMRTGKPVMFCSGPINEPRGVKNPPFTEAVEKLFAARGVEFAGQTILFDVESKAFRMTQGDRLSGSAVNLPPLSVVPPPGLNTGDLAANPISRSLQVLGRSIDQPLDIRLRAPTPVRLKKDAQAKQPFAAEFLWTAAESWNETYPFAVTFQRIQGAPQEFPVRQEPPELDSAIGAKRDDRSGLERPGPFSIGVAAESALPDDWLIEDELTKADPNDSLLRRFNGAVERAADRQANQKGRFVVIGHGSLFSRAELNPATAQLLVIACNWLLKRDERLPHVANPKAPIAIDRPWQYPRVEMSAGTKEMWHWGAFLGLPGICVYLGLIVLMIRKVR